MAKQKRNDVKYKDVVGAAGGGEVLVFSAFPNTRQPASYTPPLFVYILVLWKLVFATPSQ